MQHPASRLGRAVAPGVGVDNPALMQLLGLCPLLAVSTSAAAGLGLGLASALTLVITATVVSLGRRWIVPEVRLPVFVIVIAAVVSAIDILGAGWFYELHRRLGLFVPLIVTNCVILARLESHAAKHPLPGALTDACWSGAGFAIALVLLGAGRELLGSGCVFAGMNLLFANLGNAPAFCLAGDGILFALLPPGAFIGLALLVVVWRALMRDGTWATPDRPAEPRRFRLGAPPQAAHTPADNGSAQSAGGSAPRRP